MHRLNLAASAGLSIAQHAATVRGHRPRPQRSLLRARGFTLVEVLIATALTLVLMFMVVTVFATVTDSISTNRAAVEMNDQVRAVASLLQSDLGGVTCPLNPPLKPEDGQGYFEYIEGPQGPVFLLKEMQLVGGIGSRPGDLRVGYDFFMAAGQTPVPGFSSLPTREELQMREGWLDGTHGDSDDVLMFTTRNVVSLFRGRLGGTSTVTSAVAEVAWFLRGTTLYRRVLLVLPNLEDQLLADASKPLQNYGFYARYDISARQVGGAYDPNDPLGASGLGPRLALNSLGDLTKRENRYAHQPHAFPHDARFWGRLGLPTLRECSYRDATSGATWPFPLHLPGDAGVLFQTDLTAPFVAIRPRTTPSSYLTINPYNQTAEFTVDTSRGDGFDAWENPHPWAEVEPSTGTLRAYYSPPGDLSGSGSLRSSEDVVLNNVLAFDVKAWDPEAPVLERQLATGSLVSIRPGDPDYVDQLRRVGSDPTLRIARYGAYVDLNYLCQLGAQVNEIGVYGSEVRAAYHTPFSGPGLERSGLWGTPPDGNILENPSWDTVRASVWETTSTHYESDGLDQDGDGIVDEGTDGFDNDVANASTPEVNSSTATGAGINGIDDLTEVEVPPPYPYPLKAVQIRLRVFEPDTRQIREVTIVQEFTTH